jgi:predicted lipoprotein with Yx(FWY)xxD motif
MGALGCALLSGACGGEGNEGQSAAPEPAAGQEPEAQALPPAAHPGPTVAGGVQLTVNRAVAYGEFVADKTGQALYLFTADTAGKSRCYGACARMWPPLLTPQGTPTAGSRGLQPPLIGTTQRTDGTAQVTYNGHPLYRYAKDTTSASPRGRTCTTPEASGTS